MSTNSKSPQVRTRLNIFREAVDVLKTRLNDTFKEQNLEIVSVNDDDYVSNLAENIKQCVITEHCDAESVDPELNKILDATKRTFLSSYFEANARNNGKAVEYMKTAHKTFTGKYEKRLDQFLKITNDCILDEPLMRSFHNFTSKYLLEKYDKIEKPGNDDSFKKRCRKELEDSIEGIFSQTLHHELNAADATISKIENIIENLKENHLQVLRDNAKNVETEDDLQVVHEQLRKFVGERLKEELIAIQINPEMKYAARILNYQLSMSYQQVQSELESVADTTNGKAELEYITSVDSYKTEMKKYLELKGISLTDESLMTHHQKMSTKIMSEFSTKLPESISTRANKRIEYVRNNLKMNLDLIYSDFCDEWTAKRIETKNKLEWVSQNEIPLLKLQPAGHEAPNILLYVARALHKGNWVPGKLHSAQRKFIAYVPFNGKEQECHEFQVLIAPPETTRWVETQPRDNIPEHAVVGGFDPTTKEPTYICRAWHDGKLIVGKALRNQDHCFIPYGDKELRIKSKFEILVLNI